MRWWIFTCCTVVVLALLMLTGIHVIWAQEFPAEASVINYVVQNAPVNNVQFVDRFTGRVPCYVVHGANNSGQPVTVLSTGSRILGILPDNQILPKSNVQSKISQFVPGFHADRMSLGIYIPGEQSVDPSTVQLKPSDPSWHYVWEVFGSVRSQQASASSNYLIDIDYSTGDLIRKMELPGGNSF